jgi:DNA-binding winged helix-turn-helix (wHTH) protein
MRCPRRRAGRTEHAGFLHFGDNAVAPNEVIGKSDLINQVWPGISVEEGSLHFHIANLWKVLGDRKKGARHITKASERGYRFVAPIFAERTTQAREDELSKIACTTEHFVTVRRRPTTLVVAIGASADEQKSFV